MEPAVRVNNLAKSFGKQTILRELSLELLEGDVYGLVGLNGAGKTTLIRLLLGILKPGNGSISLGGRDPWSHDATLYRRSGVVLESDGFWGNLTFEQNLRIFAAAKKVPWPAACRYLDEHWSGSGLIGNRKPVKFFSRGQRMQCAICRAFLGDPSWFFFDEPVIALDVGAYEHFSSLVRSAQARGGVFIISSHQLDAIDDLCNRVGVLKNGHLAELKKPGRGAGGTAWNLIADPNARWASIIMEICGSAAVFKNGSWRFDVISPDTMIPELVAGLAKAGCRVGGVAPAAEGFRESIRNEYGGSLQTGNEQGAA